MSTWPDNRHRMQINGADVIVLTKGGVERLEKAIGEGRTITGAHLYQHKGKLISVPIDGPEDKT